MNSKVQHIIKLSVAVSLFSVTTFGQQPFFFSYSGDTIIVDTSEADTNTQVFFDDLQEKAGKKKWTRELHDIIIVKQKEPDQDPGGSKRTILDYLPFEGKTIRKIEFRRLDPFGTSLYDTAYTSSGSLAKFGNAVHFKTIKPVLDRHLILKEGEILDPYKVADNERLFRELKYIEDVRILVSRNELDTSTVDLLILTKDIWSKAFFLELKEVDEGKLGMWDRNIFGTGNDFENNIHWNPNKSDFWGYDAVYRSRNFLGTFINTNLYYKNVFETESYGLQLNRRFFTPATKYAGGFSAFKTRTEENIWYSPNFNPKEPLSYSTLDYWLGRSFSLRNDIGKNARRLNLVFAIRLIHNNFTTRPLATSEYLFFQYHNNTIWLNSVSLTSQAFYRTNLIYSFGRTEDIPNGWLANFTLGKEYSEFTDRIYSSARISHGDYIDNLGYVYTCISAGSFFSNSESQQGVFKVKINYFTNLFVLGRYKFRHFTNINYIKGFNRFDLERININDKNGIRGLSAGGVYGQQKLIANMESVLFSPAIRYGFRIAFFGFADFALIGEEHELIKELDNYNGFGFGFRIRNERLVFPTFQFRFAFYPGFTNIEPVNYFNFSGEKKLNPADFSTGAPELLDF